ncbi:crosslink repair DNA glycosylase YcaQ family protein [Arthrobacter sp. 260]|uniref:winged helix-turn-helix domain-containing protein n=1 Tax=Arthrobacter sp. 260 TaxID=2735314 RepID=UPI00149124CF|nr:crosslink repair DNA glycosylase YcaQ family protein [Arthrobacter sp. 260]NOJ58539.1 winged helix-turn-helix domain-containing protein [Arthrobacter sp. 260]
MTSVLSQSQARRIALGAQGLAKVRPTGPATARQVGLTFDRLQLLQIDSVNVLARSHYLPHFSRLGDYDRDQLDRLAGKAPRRMVEYWAHEASFIRPALFPYLRPLQERRWVGASSVPEGLRESLRERILEVLSVSRPLTAGQLQLRLGYEEIRSSDQWGWNWNSVKRVLEDMFERGQVSSAGRTPSFERRYALSSRVLPDPQAVAMEVDPLEAHLVLIELAARAQGVGTLRCFADYFRLPLAASQTAIQTLVDRGTLRPVTIAGWDKPAFRHVGSVLPRRAEGRALLSPFDSMVFERRRLSALFGFDYRLEIYTPAAKRRYGYYVLPFLLRETMAARIDLKADRATGRLLVRGSHAEPDAPSDTAAELAAELRLMAAWLGLQEVVVDQNGNLAAALKLAVSHE